MTSEMMKVALYIVLMVVVIFLGIAIVTGFSPFQTIKKINNMFQPGEMHIMNTDKLAEGLKMDCSNTVQTLYLNGVKFNYINKASEKKMTFVVVLDYFGSGGDYLFMGKPYTSDIPVQDCTAGNSDCRISCEYDSGTGEFGCPQGENFQFDMNNVGTIKGTHTFHFTIFRVGPDNSLIDDISSGLTLSQLEVKYPDSYLSSFDVTTNVDSKCQEAECKNIAGMDACIATAGCFWSSGLYGYVSCSLCPTSVHCADYHNYEMCSECPLAMDNCKVVYGTDGKTFQECQPVS